MCTYLSNLFSRCCHWYFAPCRNNEATEEIEESPYADVSELRPTPTQQNFSEVAVQPGTSQPSSLNVPNQSGKKKYETTAEIDERMRRVLIRELRDPKKKVQFDHNVITKQPGGSGRLSPAKKLWDDDKTA